MTASENKDVSVPKDKAT